MLFLTVLKYVLVILEVLLIFNLVIIVHELGHFLAARWRGLVVEEFGVWFGKPLWRKKIGSVYYSLGSIPAGGFVKLPQMAPMETLEGESETPRQELPVASPLNKIIVALAGPLFSVLLALVLACVVWLVGNPTSQAGNTTTIGSVVAGGPADRAGLKRGDKILEIDGKPVQRWQGALNSVIWGIMSSQEETIDFLVERDGEPLHIKSGWTREETAKWKREKLRQVLISQRLVPEVASLEPKSAAAQAGLKTGDIVVEVNGTPIITLEEIDEARKKAPTEPMLLTVARSSEPVQHRTRGDDEPRVEGASAAAPRVQITVPSISPKETKDSGGALIPGVEWGHFDYEYPTPFAQVGNSLRTMGNMIKGLGDYLFRHKGDVKPQQFSGPVGILNMYRMILQFDEGWRMAIAFSVFFNVNLAVLNMLPFPVLDGGHITLGIIESIRRRQANPRVLEWVQTACALLLFGFILYVTWFDVSEHIPWKKKNPPASVADKPAVVESAK